MELTNFPSPERRDAQCEGGAAPISHPMEENLILLVTKLLTIVGTQIDW